MSPTDNGTTPDLETQQQEGGEANDFNWDELSDEEKRAGYLRQSDYTKKTQELSAQRKQIEEEQKRLQSKQSDSKTGGDDLSEDEKNLLDWLKKNDVPVGFNLNELKESLKKDLEMENSLNQLLSNNPELAKHEKAIKDLQKVTNLPYEQIIIQYGFTSADKLEKAKSMVKMVGEGRDPNKKDKSVGDMSLSEYAKAKAEGKIRMKGNRFKKAKTF